MAGLCEGGNEPPGSLKAKLRFVIGTHCCERVILVSSQRERYGNQRQPKKWLVCFEARTIIRKICNVAVISHTWWKIYVNGSTNHSDTPFIAGIHKDGGGTDGVTLNLKGTLNTSLIGIELLDNGQSNGRLASSDEEIRDDFNWKMIANISHEVLNERIAEQGEEIGQPATETLKRSDTGVNSEYSVSHCRINVDFALIFFGIIALNFTGKRPTAQNFWNTNKIEEKAMEEETGTDYVEM
ncbi:hypothetical protein ANN_21156 [Periplaneta americana]|uniref:Uncharacterized protein n=1 Tax=Periplaneta americana TaxID=6978 RepID=A0ABQ8SEZ7_PERAM|nr:hypothetical protein ANN_21156 [Periplaneta americana]